MSLRRPSIWILAGLLGVLAWVFLAPPGLGGQTSYVVTRGNSMTPTFHTGDLAVVRQRSAYDVGDVIAYRSATLHITVLHRIVAIENGGFRTQGDHNTWIDPDLVRPDEISGRLWLHVPKVGSALPRGGLALPVLLGSAALATATAHTRARRPRRRPSRKAPVVHRTPRRNHASALLTTALVAVVSGAALLLISVRAPAAPVTESGTADVTHQLDLTYRATADNTVYQGGELVTGDPVFITMNPLIDVMVRDRVSGKAAPASRTLSLQARITGANGWQYSLPLSGEAAPGGTDSELRVTVDLRVIRDVISQAEARTGLDLGSYQLELIPSVFPASPAGTLEFPPVVFGLHDGDLVLDDGDQERGAPVTRTVTEPGSGSESGEPRLQIAGVSVATWQIRVAWAGALVLGVLLAGIGLVRRQRDPLAGLAQPVITVSGEDLPVTTVETASLKDLLDLAQRYDRPVLHLPHGRRSVYFVEEAGTWYSCAPSRQPADRPGAGPSTPRLRGTTTAERQARMHSTGDVGPGIATTRVD
jgi:signal peptidase I